MEEIRQIGTRAPFPSLTAFKIIRNTNGMQAHQEVDFRDLSTELPVESRVALTRLTILGSSSLGWRLGLSISPIREEQA
jgi:hypothetical protein